MTDLDPRRRREALAEASVGPTKRVMRIGRPVGEFFVIVVGVLVALAAESWWSGLDDRETEREYLVRLHNELEFALGPMQLHHNRLLTSIAAIDTILAWDAGSVTLSADELATLVSTAGDYEFNRSAFVFDQTYQEMLATGAFELVEDDSTRAAVTGYYHDAYALANNLGVATASGFRSLANRVASVWGVDVRTWADAPLTDAVADQLRLIVSDSYDWKGEFRFTKSRLMSLEREMVDLIELTHLLVETVRPESRVP